MFGQSGHPRDITGTGGHTNATAKLVVPLGRERVTTPELSVCAVNDPEPIFAATAVGVVP